MATIPPSKRVVVPISASETTTEEAAAGAGVAPESALKIVSHILTTYQFDHGTHYKIRYACMEFPSSYTVDPSSTLWDFKTEVDEKGIMMFILPHPDLKDIEGGLSDKDPRSSNYLLICQIQLIVKACLASISRDLKDVASDDKATYYRTLLKLTRNQEEKLLRRIEDALPTLAAKPLRPLQTKLETLATAEICAVSPAGAGEAAFAPVTIHYKIRKTYNLPPERYYILTFYHLDIPSSTPVHLCPDNPWQIQKKEDEKGNIEWILPHPDVDSIISIPIPADGIKRAEFYQFFYKIEIIVKACLASIEKALGNLPPENHYERFCLLQAKMQETALLEKISTILTPA